MSLSRCSIAFTLLAAMGCGPETIPLDDLILADDHLRKLTHDSLTSFA